MNIDKLWNRVKRLVKKKGVTQNAAALACGISPNTLRGMMAKRIVPTAFHAYIIAQYLGVSLEYLIKGRGNDKASKATEEVLSMLNKAGEKLKRIRRSTP